MKALLLSALALVVLLNSCDSGGRPVPRPEGYPRIALYEAVYRNDSIGPVIFESNVRWADVILRFPPLARNILLG